MKKMIGLLTVLSLLATMILASPVSASAEIHVYPGQSIQAAINGAVAGDTIIIHPGTYSEQVVVDKGLTVKGYGDATIIKPTQLVANTFTLFTRNGGGKTAAIVVVNAGGAPVTVQGLKIDGELITKNTGNLVQATSLVGLLVRDNAGTIDNLTVEDVGIKNASAILVTAVASAGFEVEVKNCRTSMYLKNGITATGPVVVNFHDNTVNGGGKIGYIAQNGIQVSYGATGTVHRNKVNGNSYSGSGWTASGILIFESDNVSVQGNTVTDCQTAIGIETWCWVTPSASNNKVVNNKVTGAAWGITVVSHAWKYSTGNPVADNNKIVNNVISGTDGFEGIYIGAYSEVTAFTATADNNKAITNKISGFASPIAEEGTRTKVHANVFDEE